MARVKKTTRRKRHKKILKKAKGYKQARRKRVKVAKEAVEHAKQYAYAGRKKRKRDFRRLWIQRLNAAVREQGLTYSKFISALPSAKIKQNRRELAEMAVREPEAFKKLVERVKKAL